MLDTVAVALLENGHHAGVKTVIIAVLAALVLSTLLTHVLKMLQKQDEREITRQSTGARFHSVIRDQHISWRGSKRCGRREAHRAPALAGESQEHRPTPGKARGKHNQLTAPQPGARYFK